MKLNELTTPFKRIPAICYKPDGNSIVCINKLMQHVSGNVYRGKSAQSNGNPPCCMLYVIYPGQIVAMAINVVDEESPIDKIMEACKRGNLDTQEAFVSGIKQLIEHQGFIQLKMVEYLKYIDPLLADTCMESRRAYKEKRDQIEKEKQEKKEEEERQYVAERNAEAEKTIENAIKIICKGGKLRNDRITFYRSRYDSSEYSIINYLMRKNGVNVPLKTQGWINDKLSSVEVTSEEDISAWYKRTKNGKGSTKFFECMRQLVQVIRAEKNQPE